MVLTLLAFGWMYWQTHQNPPPKHVVREDVRIIELPLDGGRDDVSRALMKAMEDTHFPSVGGDR